jgi:integrase
MIQVYLVKRFRRKRKRNGQRGWVWALRWQDAAGWRCESTGTADKVQADGMLVAKRNELNAPPDASAAKSVEEPAKATWQECRDALKRAMTADNLRPTYISNVLLTFDQLRRMFPGLQFPADVQPKHANEFKRRRAEAKASPWSIKGDLATLRAAFGKWLVSECELLQSNPFAKVKPPRCDDPEVRIVTAEETKALFDWLSGRWNQWSLPLVYLQVAALLGWRATEIASIKEDDLLPDGFIRIAAESCKTRRHKYGWLPADLHEQVRAYADNGWAFGRFSDDLRRLLMAKRRPHHAASVRDFTPKRLVQWLQDELKRFNDERAEKAKADEEPIPPSFTLHDFRRTCVTALQMAGVSEKECSLMVGCTPEVIRKHYEKMDQMLIAKRSVEKRLASASDDDGSNPDARLLRAFSRADEKPPLDEVTESSQTHVG